MHVNVAREVAALRTMSVGELRAKYAQVFGDRLALAGPGRGGPVRTSAAASGGAGPRRRLALVTPSGCQGRTGVSPRQREGQPPRADGKARINIIIRLRVTRSARNKFGTK
jgi:hypothetical protein